MKKFFLLLLLVIPVLAQQDLRPSAYLGQQGKVTVRGGTILGSVGGLTTLPQIDITPAPSSTTYIFLDLSGIPTISSSTGGFPATSYFPICTVTTDVAGIITSFHDSRPDSFMVTNVSTGTNPGTTLNASVSPSSLVFGTVQNSTVSQSQIVTVSNIGAGSLVISGAAFTTGTKFQSPNLLACNGALLGSCSLLISYAPTASITDNDTLTFTTNAPIDAQNPLTVALSGTGTAAATFTISLAGFGAGSGTVSDGGSLNCHFTAGTPDTSGDSDVCSLSYATGTSVTLTATSDTGSLFNTFAGGGLTISPATFTVTQDQSISTTFDLAPINNNLTLNFTGQGSGGVVSDISSTNGSLSCNGVAGVASSGGAQGCTGPFPQGTVITLTETPLASNTFVGWIGAPGCTTASTCLVTLNADQTVTANFTSTATINIGLVQTATNCAVVTTTVACPWASAQSAGDFLVIGIGIPDASTTVSSVADTKGNTYTQVPTISPKVGTGLTQALYYAQNIVAASAGANTTTVTLSSSAGTTPTFSNLTHGTSASCTSCATASITPSANLVVMVGVTQRNGGGNGAVNSTGISGDGLTFTNIRSDKWGTTVGSGKAEATDIWCGVGASPSTGALTITYSAGSITTWVVDQSTNSATTCAAAIGIKATHSTTTVSPLSVTMGTFNSATSATWAFGSVSTTASTLAADTGFTQLGTAAQSPITSTTEYKAANASPMTMVFVDGNPHDWSITGVEIQTASPGRRDVRALEYSGILQSGSPIDVSAAAIGTSATAAPGSMTTGTASDLIVAFNLSNQSVNTPATSFTQRLKNTFGDDAEDIEGAATGAYNPSVALTASGNWVASQVSFKPQTGQAATVFSATVNILGNGSGSVSGNIGNPLISCPTTCSSQVTSGSTLTLTASANSGSVFVSWSGITGCGTSAQCQVPNITSNQNVSATFSLAGTLNFFVNNATGNNNNSGLCAVAGTPAGCTGPFASIQAAINAVAIGASGTTITVAHATYSEGPTISRGGISTSRRLVIKCNAQWTVGGSTGCKTTGHWNITGANFVDLGAINKFGFEYTSSSDGVGIDGIWQCGTATTCAVGNSIHIIGNYMHDIAQTNAGGCPFSAAILIPPGHGRTLTDIEVIGNLVDHFGIFPNSGCSSAQGIYIASSGGQVYDNIVTRNPSSGLQYYDAACNARISNNVFVNNKVGMVLYGGNGCSPVGHNTVDNNVIANNLQYAINNSLSGDAGCSSGNQTLYSNNIIFGNPNVFTSTPSACTIVQNQKSENPTSTFVSYTGDATGNYQLKGTSIAINGGTLQCVSGGSSPCVPNFDFLNVARPQRATFDIGAFELP